MSGQWFTPDWTLLPLAYLRRIVMPVEEQNAIVNQWIVAWNKQDLAPRVTY